MMLSDVCLSVSRASGLCRFQGPKVKVQRSGSPGCISGRLFCRNRFLSSR